jgi:hypothetical protein
LLDRINEFFLREWETVCKHRDPLVCVGEDEPANPHSAVDNRTDRPQNGAVPLAQEWVGGRAQKAAGAGAFLRVRGAAKSGPKEDSPELRKEVSNMSQTGREPPERNPNLRTTTTTIVPPNQNASSASPASANRPSRDLDALVDEYSDQFGDSRHVASNRSRARRLWQQTGLSSEDFARALIDAGARTIAHTANVENRMSYFFGVLKGVLREWGLVVHDRQSIRLS